MVFDNIDKPLVTHLACVFGAYIASRYALKTYMAIYSLASHARNSPSFPIAPSESSIDEQAQQGQQDQQTRPWWRKLFTKDGFAFMIVMLIILAIQVFIVVVLPRITSKMVMDSIWTVMVSLLVGARINSTLLIFYPTPIARKLRFNKAQNLYHSEIIPRTDAPTPLLANKRFRLPTIVVLTAAILGQAYWGVTGLTLLPLVGMGIVIDLAGHSFYPKLSVRRAVQVVIGLLLVASALGFFLGPIVNMLKKDKSDTSPAQESEQKPQVMSPWIADIGMLFNVGGGLMLPASLLAVTLRYEYMRSSAPRPLPVDEEHKVIVPTSVPKFEKPIFNTGLTTLVLGILIHNLVVPRLISFDDMSRNIMIYFSGAPSAVVGLMAAAWYKGKFNDWWSYRDEWYPKPLESGQDESQPLLDEEKTVAFTDHDEKVVNDLVQLDDEQDKA
ncbi:hypothetical protein IAU59_005090 [Kwoniella sp. CBS 9459]